jgi:hypothetical protein
VENLLTGRDACDAVIALTDVYTGTKDFKDAADAKAQMKKWVGTILNFIPMQLPMTLKLGCYLFGQKFSKYQEAIERFLAVLLNW